MQLLPLVLAPILVDDCAIGFADLACQNYQGGLFSPAIDLTKARIENGFGIF
ncbi:MAG TPA: hypothetical protein VFX18_03410 [Candidatus Nitrosocosmicus sp.]|nr:hypothetical protein [Candidatus Nitrosocosmicus sp.]